MGPLSDILVVSLEQAVAAPLCTARLADAGARVIKVERAEGDFARDYDHVVNGGSAYFVWLNRGKQSIRLDIKDRDDAALLHRMIARADVFVQNLLPGAAERASFGSAALRALHPRLVTCDLTGYGEGPLRDRKAYDLLIQCEAGLTAVTGGASEPGRVGVSVADIACGMNAYGGILEALIARQRTGGGAGLSVSLFDGIADWMAVPLLYHDYAGQAPARVGVNHATIAPYGAYRTGDGRQTVFSVQNEREWFAFASQVIGRPDLAKDARFAGNALRCSNRPALDAEIDAALAVLDAAELARRLESAAIAFGALNEVADLSIHPHLRRVTVETPEGGARIPAPPVRWEGGDRRPGAVPALGENDEPLRTEFAA